MHKLLTYAFKVVDLRVFFVRISLVNVSNCSTLLEILQTFEDMEFHQMEEEVHKQTEREELLKEIG